MVPNYSDYYNKAEKFAKQLYALLSLNASSTVVDSDGNPVDSNGFSSTVAIWASNWTSAFYEDLCEGFEQEQRENFRQCRDAKTQDRFSTELCLLLKRYLVPLFDEMVKKYRFKKNDDGRYISAENTILTDRLAEDAEVANDVLKVLNRLLHSIQRYLMMYAPELWQRYKDKGNILAPIKEQPQLLAGTVKLQWKGDKTDLAELIWALQKSERITDTTTGKPVTQKELVSQLTALLGIDTLDVANLMKYKYGTKSKSTSYKAKDGKTFPAELQQLLSSRIID